MKVHFAKSLQNIIKHGDTDIFPFPFERYLFEHSMEKTLDILDTYYSDIDQALVNVPPQNILTLSQVGYYGYRGVDLISPFWNAFYLGLVISIAEQIEQHRIAASENIIFSYRYSWDDEKASLFKNTTWSDYKQQCVANAKVHPFVLQTDISNFYPRINHKTLESDLECIDADKKAINCIMRLLYVFSNQLPYGLPVGGPASRILAELTLNKTDQFLKDSKFVFCRYADDFTVFCASETDAYRKLIMLSKILAENQLSLHKDKTKIMASAEFREIHQYLEPKPAGQPTTDVQKMFQLTFRFNPYAENDTTEPEALKDALREIDIVALLSREVKKTKIDQTLTKQAVNAVKALTTEQQAKAISLLLDHNNMLILSPVFTTIIRMVRSLYEKLPTDVQDFVDQALIGLFRHNSFLIHIEVNTSYLIQLLSLRHTAEKEGLLASVYASKVNPYIKRQIMVTMANWMCREWLLSIIPQYPSMSSWEKSGFIYASYALGDEGKHWRGQQQLSTEEALVNEWSDSNIQANKTILV
jgi:hypothetical protein